MRIPRIYVPEPAASGKVISVTGQTAHHVAQVLRLHPGDSVRIFDGSGGEWNALVLDIKRSEIRLETATAIESIAEPSLDITLAQGIARNDRMDFILQKSVELGVSRIQPLWMRRCQTRVKRERLDKRLQHWQGIIVSACEQCGRSTLPKLCPPADYPTWISRKEPTSLGLMLQPDSSLALHNLPAPEREITILVGPEGGLAPDEQQLAVNSGFLGIRLGQRILRTETAALSALAGMHALWGDFRSGADHGQATS